MSQEVDWSKVLGEPLSKPKDEWANVLGSPKRKQNELTEEEFQQMAGLQEYSHQATKEWGFWDPAHSAGYKIHLNVAPENATSVSAFLKQQDYEHKFLSGGEISDGKVFTVYTGSRKVTEQIVDEISQAIGGFLLKGIASGERAFDADGKIKGRFEGDINVFSRKRSIDGVNLLRGSNSVEDAQKRLEDMYGEYFTG